MNELLDFGLQDLITRERLMTVLHALIILFVGFLIARTISALAVRMIRRRATPQGAMLIRRLIYYSLLVLVAISALRLLGFELGVLLGAAGIFTVAIGFASQTSASNLISGLFLIAERPFVVGDIIKVGDLTGTVLSIDLLSIKLRTFDNLYVRVPNESIIKSQITNLTYFPLRRIDMKIGVAYKEDLDRVREILFDLAEKNPLCMADPQPLFIFEGFGDSALQMQFSVWAMRQNFLEVRNSLQLEIKKAFDAEGIEIPFPQRTIHAGSTTVPFPVQVLPSPRAES